MPDRSANQTRSDAGCPGIGVLEEIAAGRAATTEESMHLGVCGMCRAALDELQAQALIHARLRVALAPAGGADSDGLPEDLIPGYKLLGEVDRGSQGIVYKAVQERTKRTVAVKMLLGGAFATDRQRARFEREVEIVAGLNHPGIVTVYDRTPVRGGRYAYAMEYIDASVPLDAWRPAPGAGPRAEARTKLVLFAEICDAVHYAHQRGVIHRDLKPANILVDVAGRPHVLDFGIARATEPDGSYRTLTVEFSGTLAYASPEQIAGRRDDLDVRTDVYSLGVILFELLSGRLPHQLDGRSIGEAARIMSQDNAPRLAEIDRSCRGDLDTIVAKALEHDVGRRYESAAALAADIRRHLTGRTIEARRDSTWYVLRKIAARHLVVVASAGLFVVLLAVFGAAMTWQAHRLDVRGRELAGALSDSNVERGRSLAAAGQTPVAEDVVFPELIRAGVTRIDGPEVGFSGSPEAMHAYWALWDIFRNSHCVATLRTLGSELDAHPPWDEIRLIYFDDGGHRLNAVNNHGRLVSWSAATWKPVRDISLFADVKGTNFRLDRSPDGNILVLGAGTIRIIDPESGQVVVRMDDPGMQAVFGRFNPDGTLIVTTGHGNRICVRDAKTLAVVVALEGTPDGKPDGPCWSKPIFSPDGHHIAAARTDGGLGVWNATSGALERKMRQTACSNAIANAIGHVGALAFATDGTIASSWANFYLLLWPAEGSAPRELAESGGIVSKVEFLPGSEGRQLVSTGSSPGGGGGITKIWDVATGACVATFNHPDDTCELTISPDGKLLATGMTNGMVQVHETAPEPQVTALQNGQAWPSPRLAISPEGRRLAVASQAIENDWTVTLIDLKTRETINRFHRTGPGINAIEFGRDGSSLFESDASGRVRQWDLRSNVCVREFVFPEPHAIEPQFGQGQPGIGGTNQLRLSPDGLTLARARDDGLIGLWDVASGAWIGLLDSDTKAHAVIDFSHDSRTLVAHHPKKLVLWDVPTRRIKRTIAIGQFPNCVRYSPTGPVIALSASFTLQFFDADTGRMLSEGTPRTAGMGMAFHPEGTVFFATAHDSSVRLWDTRTGRELLSLRKHIQFMREFVLTPDGNTLISSDWAGTVLVWDLTYYNDRIRRELEYRVSHSAEP